LLCLPNLVPYDADILFDTQNGMEGTLLRDRLILAGSNMEAAFLNLEAMLAAVIAAGLAMLLLLYIATPFTLAGVVRQKWQRRRRAPVHDVGL
jgi:hypothetical protein